jgi:hypothetical protein
MDEQPKMTYIIHGDTTQFHINITYNKTIWGKYLNLKHNLQAKSKKTALKTNPGTYCHHTAFLCE